jgi:carbohydrate-selective porin OprB
MSFSAPPPRLSAGALSFFHIVAINSQQRLLLAVLLLLTCPATVALAGPEAEAPAPAPLAVEGSYTLDASTIVSGPSDRGDTATRGLMTLGADFYLEALTGWRGAHLFASVQGFRGENGSERLGDFQGYSNIDTDEIDDLAEVWLEQRWRGGRTRLKVGKIDANTEFAFVDSAGDFLSSSAGFSPTVLSMPTYPDPTVGANASFDVGPSVRLAGGVFESPLTGDPFTIGEVEGSWSGTGRVLEGRASVGAWRDSGGERDPAGTFAVLEQAVRVRRCVGPLAGPTLRLFAQYGEAEPHASEVRRHAAAGVVAEHLLSRREDDRFGLMVSRVSLRGPEPASHETAIELFYGFPVSSFLRLQPDVQYVMRPSGERGRTATVVSLRVQVAF